MRYLILLSAVAFIGCKSGTGSHDEGHDHEAEEHEHAVEEARGHEGHNHEEGETEEGGHADEIVFTRAQAEAAGLTV